MSDPPRVTPLTGADLAALRRFADAVLDARDGFRDNVKLFTERANELAADPIRAALCRGQAMAYEAAAGHIDEAVAIATGRWGRGGASETPCGRVLPCTTPGPRGSR